MMSYLIKNALLLMERGFYLQLIEYPTLFRVSSRFLSMNYTFFEEVECERIEGWAYRKKKTKYIYRCANMKD